MTCTSAIEDKKLLNLVLVLPMNNAPQLASSTRTELLDLAMESIIVGASFNAGAEPDTSTSESTSLTDLASDLTQLKQSLEQINFPQQIPLETPLIKEAYRFMTAKENLTHHIETLASASSQLGLASSEVSNNSIVTIADSQRHAWDLSQLLTSSEEQLKQTELPPSEIEDFKESAQKLNLPGSNAALFISVIHTAREHFKACLNTFRQQVSRDRDHVQEYLRSQNQSQSELHVKDLAPGYFQISATPWPTIDADSIFNRVINKQESKLEQTSINHQPATHELSESELVRLKDVIAYERKKDKIDIDLLRATRDKKSDQLTHEKRLFQLNLIARTQESFKDGDSKLYKTMIRL